MPSLQADRISSIKRILRELDLIEFPYFHDDGMPRDDDHAMIILFDNPRFENAGKCHDWRNHIPEEIQNGWKDLPDVAKAIAIYMAEQVANREEWE